MAESPTMEVRARLTADSAQFTKGLEEASKSAQNFQGASAKLNASLNALGAVAAGTAIGLIAFATQSFRAAAEVQELDIALQAIGKSTRYGYTQLSIASEEIQNVGLSAVASRKAIIKLAQSNVDLSDATQLATIAQDLSVTASVNSADALNSLIFAITTGQTRMLRQIGITAGATEAFAIYGRTIGKSASDLSMAERRQAVLNLILKEGIKVQGAYALAIQSPSRALKEMNDQTRRLQEAVGLRLLNAFSALILSTLELRTRLARAAEGTGAFAKVLDALEKVLTKLSSPFATLTTNIGNFIEKLDKSKISVNEIASTMEKVLPIAAAFATFFGIRAGKSLSQAAPFFQGFFDQMQRFNLVFSTFVLAITSPQIRGALAQLISAFAPLLPIIKNLGLILAEVSAIGLGVIAKAIRLVASAISSSIAFIQKYSAVFKTLLAVVGVLAVAYGAYMAQVFVVNAYTKIQNALTLAQATATGLLTKAQLMLNAAMRMNPIGLVVAGIAALVTAIVILYKNSETFADGFTKVFNFVASVVGRVVAFIVRAYANYLLAVGNLLDINNTFGQVVAAVFQFVYDTIINVFLGVVRAIKSVYDAFLSLMENNEIFRRVVVEVFNAVLRIISLAVTMIVTSFANILKAIASGIYIFERFFDVVRTVVRGVIGAFAILGRGIFNVFRSVGTGIGNFLSSALDTVRGWVSNVVGLLMQIPGVGDLLKNIFEALSRVGNSAVNSLQNIGGRLSDALFGQIENGSIVTLDALSSVSSNLIKSSKGWGNYSEGAAGAISGIANRMLDFNMKLIDFTKQDNGSKVVAGLIKGATFASEGYGKIISQLEKIQGFKIGEFIVKNTSEAAVKASNFLFGLATSIESFTQGNVLGKLGGVFTDIADSFKTGLGFGDVLAEEKKKADDLSKVNASNDTAADELQNSADVMKKIREAMADGIQSMKDVLGDLQQAAKDFADSLKDTILGFAGLRGVELPDGFIPKAKSLIENMRMRLDKSQKFAQQIGTLQGLGLDTKALQDIIESGPLKGAQLAASIIGGGVDAVNQINELQKKISFTGAAIGAFGADAAFSGQIASAQLGIAQVTDAEAKVRGLGGNNIVIEQGAFVVNVDTTGATNQDEKADIITRRIQETFAILAKELANK
jgi:phage-related protein